MGLFQIVCMCLLAAVAQTQEFENCGVNSSPSTIGSTEDAAALASSLQCSNGVIAVQWVEEVLVRETIRVTHGTSLNITGAGPGAIADGGTTTQLFSVEGGSSLHILDLTLANGIATGDGGAIFANQSTVSFHGNMSFVSNSAMGNGGALFASGSTVSWDGDRTNFSNNFAGQDGGAISVLESSTVSWDVDGTQFSNNTAGDEGGAILVSDSSTVSWGGDGTQFSNNAVGYEGGAISVSDSSTVSWGGDGTQFSNNNAGEEGGAILVSDSSTVSWGGDGTQFSNNAVGYEGGAISVSDSSTVSWGGNGTQFSNNNAGYEGGAISVSDSSTVSWGGNGTQFSNNNAGEEGGAISVSDSLNVSWGGDGTEFTSNTAGSSGGAIYVWANSGMSCDGANIFSSNVAVENGGALAFEELSSAEVDVVGATLVNNSAGNLGGAIFLSNSVSRLGFTDVTFESNSATDGGAVAAYDSGSPASVDSSTFLLSSADESALFRRCIFSNNEARDNGGAVEASSGYQWFDSCEFEGNSAYVGGAMRLGGEAAVHSCSFLSNSAASGGFAVDVIRSATFSASSFDSNELNCKAGSYRQDSEQEESTARFEAVCSDCPDWDECSGCTIERGSVTSTCERSLEHTSANVSGITLATLNIEKGYWRATSESDSILACYNADACKGGLTGAGSFCASGYDGPYCAVCETDYSPSLSHTCTRCSSSRRQGLVAAAVIGALVVVFAVATIFKFLLSTEVEEGNIGCFRRRVLRVVPVHALKIIVVMWQILTQFADAANVTYPGVYQDFLSAIDVINFDLGSVLAAGCLWSDIDFHGRLLVSTIGPLVVVGFLAMTYLVAVRRIGASSESAVEKVRHKHLTALLLLTFLVYSSVSSMVFQTFACETLDDGIEYLRADYSIHCTDDKHKAFQVYAGIMVFVYPLGIPMLYAALLFQRRDVLADAGADKSVAQPISGLWEAYRPERFYYEVIECGRRILLTGVVVFIFPNDAAQNDAAQIAITMLIAFFFLVVFDVLSPYQSESDMWLSRGGHLIVFLSMFDLLLLKVDVSGERDQSQAAFAGVLVSGHVLMILAIVVEVVGVCYASRKQKVGEEGEEEASERARVGSDDVPAFESAPASWRSFFGQRSVSEKTGPTRSVSGNLVTTVGP